MSDEYIPGEYCKCSAYCSCNCNCGADWTPKRVYQLESEILLLDEQLDTLFLRFGKTQERMIDAERALQKIADWELAPDYDPMDAVREIAREALATEKGLDDDLYRN